MGSEDVSFALVPAPTPTNNGGQKTLLALAAATLVFAVVVAACGFSDPTPVIPTAAPTPTNAVAAPTATPSSGAEPIATTAFPQTSTRIAKDDDSVQVHYHGTLDSGEVFDSSRGGQPLTFVVGSGQVIEGFDILVRGLAVGETATSRLEPEQAYGARDESLIFQVPQSQMPEGVSVGEQLRTTTGATVVVVEVTDEFVRIDANHQLAGQALTFEIELVSIE